MIQINLLPKELQKKKIGLPEISFSPLIAIFLGIAIVAHLSFSLSINLKGRALKRLEGRWQEISPDVENADKLRHELMAMRAKIDAIDNLMQNRLNWAKKLSDLSDAMTPGVWLNKLWLEKEAVLQEESGREGAARSKSVTIKALHLNGSVIASGGTETAAIGKFIRGLKNNEGFFSDFHEVESASIQRTQLKDTEVMNFELICHFQ